MNRERDDFAAHVSASLISRLASSLTHQLLNPSGARAAAMLALGFLALSVGWQMSLDSPDVWEFAPERLRMIDEHFVLDPGDLDEGRWHTLLLHGLLYEGLLHTAVMTGGLFFFASYCERRASGLTMLLVFGLGVVVGGYCHMWVTHAPRAADLEMMLRHWEQAAPTLWLGDVCELLRQALVWLDDDNPAEFTRFMGPGGGVSALAVFCVSQQFLQSRRRLPLVLGVTTVWVLADWFGFFHFEMSVGIPARIFGAVAGLVASAAYFVATRPRSRRFRVRNRWMQV